MLTHVRLLALLCGFLWASLAAGTMQKDSRDQGSKPILRVTTRVVQVGVIVQDDRGLPVRGLKADDFAIHDNGRPQQVAFFSEASSTAQQQPSPPLGPHTYTNQFQTPDNAPSSLTMLLLDGLNTSWQHLDNARRQFARFIATQVRPTDRIAVFTLGRDLRVLHSFSDNTGTLVRAMAGLSDDLPAETMLAGEPTSAALRAGMVTDTSGHVAAFERFLQASAEEERAAVIQRRAERTLEAVEAIAQHVASAPGRKNLVWVSAGFPLVLTPDSFGRFSDVMGRAVRAINQANIALYPVDARGLPGFFEVTPSFDPEVRVYSRAQARGLDLKGFLLNASAQGTLRELAEQTGGRAFVSSNDILGSIRAAIEDGQACYTLSFYPSHQNWNGAYHQLQVSVRPKGLRVRHRLGYFAFADAAPNHQERQAAIRAALAGAIDVTDLGMTLVLDPQSVQGSQLRFELRVRAGELRFVEADGFYTAVFDMVVAQRQADGRQLTAESNRIDLRVKRETYEGFLREGISVGAEVKRLPGACGLKVVVSDTASSAIGSLTIPIPPRQPAN